MENKAPLHQMISEAETVDPLITDAMIQVGCGSVFAHISLSVLRVPNGHNDLSVFDVLMVQYWIWHIYTIAQSRMYSNFNMAWQCCVLCDA